MSKLLEATLSLDDTAEQSVWARALGVSLLARGELQEYATRKGRTRQAVSRWIAARRCYEMLKQLWWNNENHHALPHPIVMRDELSAVGYRLTLEHHVEAGEFFNKHEPDPYEIHWALYLAWTNGIDAKEMRRNMDDVQRGGEGKPEYFRRMEVLAGEGGKLLGDFHVPEEVREATKIYLEVIKPYLEQGY